MNTGMLENPITQDNIATLERYGFMVIPSESGVLACKDVGSGRLPKEDVLIEYILHAIARPKDLAGLRIAVTAGPTQEPLDPVRYLTNHSTGKMGYALARAAAMRGADVTLIHGETALQPVKFTTDVPVTTAQQMYEAVTSRFDATDVLVMAAAVADYRPAAVANDKIKKKDGDMSIPLERTPDILGTIGPKKTHQFLCGFSMETRDLVENSSAKLTKKNLDMVVANNLKVAGAGFGVDTNVVTLITPDGTRELPLMSKADVADAIRGQAICKPTWPPSGRDSPARYRYSRCPQHRRSEFAAASWAFWKQDENLVLTIDMDDRIVVFGKGGEKFGIFHQICGGGFGHFAARTHIGKHICRVDRYAVQIAILAHQNVHGHQGNVPLCQKLFGQVAGAVRCDLDSHIISPFIKPFCILCRPHQRSLKKLSFSILPQMIQSC